MAKYEARFVHKLQDGVPRDVILTFGDRDAVSVGKRCFEYGMSGNFTEVRIVKSWRRGNAVRNIGSCIDFAATQRKFYERQPGMKALEEYYRSIELFLLELEEMRGGRQP